MSKLYKTYFDDELTQGQKQVKLEFKNAKFGDKVKVEYYLVDIL